MLKTLSVLLVLCCFVCQAQDSLMIDIGEDDRASFVRVGDKTLAITWTAYEDPELRFYDDRKELKKYNRREGEYATDKFHIYEVSIDGKVIIDKEVELPRDSKFKHLFVHKNKIYALFGCVSVNSTTNFDYSRIIVLEWSLGSSSYKTYYHRVGKLKTLGEAVCLNNRIYITSFFGVVQFDSEVISFSMESCIFNEVKLSYKKKQVIHSLSTNGNNIYDLSSRLDDGDVALFIETRTSDFNLAQSKKLESNDRRLRGGAVASDSLDNIVVASL